LNFWENETMFRFFAIKLSLIFALFNSTSVMSADIQKGLTAANQGNFSTALQEFRPLADQGIALAQYSLGVMYNKGMGVPRSSEKAIMWWQRAAAQGFVIAQYNLGNVYHDGLGVRRNYKTAIKWWKLAAEQGQADAQNNLGTMYRQGRGISQDYELSARWYRLAADHGNANAQQNLGQLYRQGLGVPRNYKAARKWWNLAAKQGNASAQNNLGELYKNGHGVTRNHEIAARWYKLAANQGNIYAQGNLGAMYGNGHGVPQDNIRAHMWWTIAASQGEKLSRKNRDIVAKLMTQTQIQTSKKLVRNFVPKPATSIVTTQKISPKVIPKISALPEIRNRSKPNPTPPSKSATSGSGFFVSKLGHIVTNQHVVKECSSLTVGDNAKTQVRAEVIETDKRNDLALLKISSTEMASVETKSLISKLGLRVVPLSSNGLLRSEDVELGERLLVAGYPYGEIFSNTIKVTGGMVSAIRGIGDDTGQFQMDAAVQPGNSGGPIYDAKGNIVGVVISQLNRLKVAKTIGSLPELVNFGIKASTVRQFLTASGLPTKWSARTQSMSTKDLAKIAQNQTVMVVCER
jgi:uncharacterized protein